MIKREPFVIKQETLKVPTRKSHSRIREMYLIPAYLIGEQTAALIIP